MILVVGLSPAWQRSLVFEDFIPGKVNRATHVGETASGKGVNVARVASILGAKVRLLTMAGGHRGERLQKSLHEIGISTRIIRVKAETRICQTVLARNTTTELVEETGPLNTGEVTDAMAAFTAEVQRADLVVLTGTVPKGCGNNFYARLVSESSRRGVRVLIDAQGAQLKNALRRKPFLVRINREELAAISGSRHVLVQRGPQWAVISDGAKSVRVAENCGQLVTALKPRRVKAKNATGSGDAMMAGIAVALWRGWEVLDAVRLGMACGAANAMTVEPGFVRLPEVRRLCSTHNKGVPIV